jgi:hypothetical protein
MTDRCSGLSDRACLPHAVEARDGQSNRVLDGVDDLVGAVGLGHEQAVVRDVFLGEPTASLCHDEADVRPCLVHAPS